MFLNDSNNYKLVLKAFIVSQSDVLAIFNPQTPVEPVAAPQKYDGADEDGFKRIMDDASNKVSPPKEGNKSDTDRQDAPSSRSHI